jgi:hypothetical protein
MKTGFGESVKNGIRAEIMVRVMMCYEDCYNGVGRERLGLLNNRI